MAVSAEVIKTTQDNLGKYIKKPPLTEKLLTKPPFRFLHDVFSIAMRETGVLDGLFQADELDSNNVKDKDAKVLYLGKIIDCLSFATQTNIQVKPGKIVSGQEADKTNLLLQALATVIENKIDTGDAVKKVLAGEKPSKPKKSAPKDEAKKKDRSADKSADRAENKENRENNTRSAARSGRRPPVSRQGSKESPRKPISRQGSKESPRKTVSRKSSPPPTQDNGVVDDGADGEEVNNINGDMHPYNNNNQQQDSVQSRINSAEQSVKEVDVSNENGMSSDRKPDPRIQSASNSTKSPEHQKIDNPEVFGGAEAAGSGPSGVSTGASGSTTRPSTAAANRPGSGRPKTGRLRPPSARPAAPRIREKKEVPITEARPQTAKVANLILDNEEDDDNAEEFIIQESAKDPLASLEPDIGIQGSEPMEGDPGDHGGLVQQILETQKELQHGNKIQKPVEIERETGVGEVGRTRERETVRREIDKLRGSIQTLTRSANPLGKLMDFLQEDVDSMQRELDTWRQDNKQLQLQLRQEETLTQETLKPLSEHLTELTSALHDQLEKISVVKSNILKNEEKMSKMVGGIGVSAR